MYRQYELRSDDHRLTCWLESDHRLTTGTLLTLKNHPEPERHWEVVRVSGWTFSDPPERRWKVGGLM